MADKSVRHINVPDQDTIDQKFVELSDGEFAAAVTVVPAAGGVHGGRKTLSYAFTRPDNATAYADNDVVNDSDSAGVDPSFANAVRAAGAGFTILGAELCMSAIGSTTPKFMLELFRAAPAAQNDNAAYAPSAAERATSIGLLRFDGANAEIHNSTVKIPGRWDGDGAIGGSIDVGTTLYGKLLTDGTWTPSAEIDFTILLNVDRD